MIAQKITNRILSVRNFVIIGFVIWCWGWLQLAQVPNEWTHFRGVVSLPEPTTCSLLTFKFRLNLAVVISFFLMRLPFGLNNVLSSILYQLYQLTSDAKLYLQMI